MRRNPIAAKHFDRFAFVVCDCVDRKRRIYLRDDFHKGFVNGVSVQNSGADACAPRFWFAVKSKSVRCGNRPREAESRTNQFSPARKSGEIMKRDAADDDNVVVFDESAV